MLDQCRDDVAGGGGDGAFTGVATQRVQGHTTDPWHWVTGERPEWRDCLGITEMVERGGTTVAHTGARVLQPGNQYADQAIVGCGLLQGEMLPHRFDIATRESAEESRYPRSVGSVRECDELGGARGSGRRALSLSGQARGGTLLLPLL